jgi:hypothetical protein
MAIKIVVGVKRRQGLSVVEFKEAWTKHGERVQQHPLTSRYLIRYVQNYTDASAYEKGEPLFDGFVEEWFESYETYNEFRTNPEYLGTLKGKIAEFTDTTRRFHTIVDEKIVLPV